MHPYCAPPGTPSSLVISRRNRCPLNANTAPSATPHQPLVSKFSLTLESTLFKYKEVLCAVSTDNWECALSTKTRRFSFILESSANNAEPSSVGCFGAKQSIASFSKTLPSPSPCHGERQREKHSLCSLQPPPSSLRTNYCWSFNKNTVWKRQR